MSTAETRGMIARHFFQVRALNSDMKTILCLALALLALPVKGGLTYEFRTITRGVQQASMAGRVEAEGGRFRIEFQRGDGFLFRDGTFAVTNAATRMVRVADPASKTYYELDLNQLLSGSGAILGQFSEYVKFSLANQQVKTTDAGSGGTIEGYPTRRKIVDASSDVALDMAGQKSTMRISLRSEHWTTDQIGREFITFLQEQGRRTGVDGLDTLLDLQAKSISGFPLKQVSTLRAVQSGLEVVTTTSTTISKIARRPMARGQFEVPAGYSKTLSPMEKMKAMRAR